MVDAQVQTNAGDEATGNAPRGRLRSCVGCGERVDLLGPEADDFVRLVLGPDGAIAVDAGSRRGGGFGRGAHLHTRPDCLERAAKAGLARATKGKAHLILDENGGDGAVLSAGSLARAIQRAMDRRIEGLLAAAVRSRRAACGANAVTGACKRGEAELVLVACDAAAAADLTEVRRAVAGGRAVAWGTKQGLGAIAPAPVRGRLGVGAGVSRGQSHQDGATNNPFAVQSDSNRDLEASSAFNPAGGSPPGIGVVAISSRPIAEALRRAVHAVDRISAVQGRSPPPARSGRRGQGGSGGGSAGPPERGGVGRSNLERGA